MSRLSAFFVFVRVQKVTPIYIHTKEIIMEKRLTTTAMMFSVGFVCMLVFAVGAFFYGVQIGMDKVEAKYKSESGNEDNAAVASLPYQQQDLVSFYHTVFSPYREFQSKWLDAMNKLSQGQNMDAASTFSSLAKLADQKATEASTFDMGKSELLGTSQIGYARSLKLFKDAASKAASASKNAELTELRNIILEESNYKAAAKEALNAQTAYYTAMQKWAASIDPDIPDTYNVKNALALKEWSGQPLIIKNVIVVNYLAERGELEGFYPQDLTSRVDDFIQSGQAAKMKLQTAGAIVDLLLSTDAVRTGQFNDYKLRFYQSEMLPLLPFFLPDQG